MVKLLQYLICYMKPEQLVQHPSMKKDYIILDNPSNKELRRPDFIKELCQYKTRCICCRMLIKRVLGLLEAIDGIKKGEVIGVCAHCKRRDKVTCKRCQYLIDKYLAQKKVEENEKLFRHWLEELEQVLIPLPGDVDYDVTTGSSRVSTFPKESVCTELFPKYPPETVQHPQFGSPYFSSYPRQPFSFYNDPPKGLPLITHPDGEPRSYLQIGTDDKTPSDKLKSGGIGQVPLIDSTPKVHLRHLLSKFAQSMRDQPKTPRILSDQKNISPIKTPKKGQSNVLDQVDSIKKKYATKNKPNRSTPRITPKIQQNKNDEHILLNEKNNLGTRHRANSTVNTKSSKLPHRKTRSLPDKILYSDSVLKPKPSKHAQHVFGLLEMIKKRNLSNQGRKTREGKIGKAINFKLQDNEDEDQTQIEPKPTMMKKQDDREKRLEDIDVKPKEVVMKIRHTKRLRQPKNLHEADIKIEKAIYNEFLMRMKLLDEAREKRRIELKKRRKLDRSILSRLAKEELKEKRKQLSHRQKSYISVEKKGLSDSVMVMHEKEEDESLIVVMPQESVDEIESISDAGPTERDIEKTHKSIIKGDRIIRLKKNESLSLPVYISANLYSSSSKVNYNPAVTYIKEERPHSKLACTSLISGILHYELSDSTWIDKGVTILPKQVVVKEICLYEMVPLEKNWFITHRDQTLFYNTGEKLAVIDQDGNGKIFYKNGKLAIVHWYNKDLNPERLVVYSSGEGPCVLSASVPVQKLAVFDHIGSGIVFDDHGHPRVKYNQSEGQKYDCDVKGIRYWKFHSLNSKPVIRTIYEENVETVMPSSIHFFERKNKDSRKSTNERISQLKDKMLAIERENKLKSLETREYDLFDCEVGPFQINKYFTLNIVNQSKVKLKFHGAPGVVLNLGMRMISTSLIGYLLGKECEVVTPLDDNINIQYY